MLSLNLGVSGDDTFYGIQVGVMPYAEELIGFQGGGVTYAKKFTGIQISPTINICSDGEGVQIAPLNWRGNALWYAKLVPGIAIRRNTKNLERKL